MGAFDSVIDELFPNPTDPVADATKDFADRRAQQLGSVMYSATSVDPDEQAKALDLSKATGVPTDVARRNMPQIQRQAAMGDLDFAKMLQESNITAEALKDPDFANVAHDDVDTLTWFEQTWNVARKSYKEGDINRDLMLAYSRLWGGDESEGLKAHIKELEGRAPKEKIPTDGVLQDMVRASAGQVPILQEIAFRTAQGAGLGSSAALVAGPAGFVPGITAGAMAGGFEGTFLLEVGSIYRELLHVRDNQGNPVHPTAARLGAFIGATPAAALELVPMAMLVRHIPGVDTLLSKLGDDALNQVVKLPNKREALVNFVKNMSAVIAAETATEAGQSVLEDLGVAAGQALSPGDFKYKDLDQIVENAGESAKEALLATPLIALPFTGTRLATDLHRARKAEDFAEDMRAVGERVRGSTLFQRRKESFEEFVQKVAEDGGDANIYADAGDVVTYAQTANVDAKALLTQLGVEEQVTEALARGADLVIPLSKFISLADTPHYDGLLDTVKEDPGAPSLREVLAERANRQQRLQQEAEQILANVDQQDEVRASAQRVADTIRDQLIQNTGQSPEVAERNAALHFANAVALGEELGITPEEAYQRTFGLTVQRLATTETVVEGQTYNQQGEIETTTPAFQKFIEGSVVQEPVFHGTISDFSEFARGDIGFHFGDAPTANTALQRQLQGRGIRTRIGEPRVVQASDGTWTAMIGDEPVVPGFADRKEALRVAFQEARTRPDVLPDIVSAGSPNVMPVYLQLKNPFRVEDLGTWDDPDMWLNAIDEVPSEVREVIEDASRKVLEFSRGRFIKDMVEAFQDAGYDGLVYTNTIEGTGQDSYVVFEPGQIKSVFNRGTFDRTDQNILFQRQVYEPRVPRPESRELPLPHGRVETELQRKLDAGKGDPASLTSRRLANVFGAPKKRKDKANLDVNVKPTSYKDLQEFMRWALNNDTAGNWYDEFGRGLIDIVGEANLHEASIIFGITSSQNAAETNLSDTLHIMSLARRFNPVSDEANFRNALRTTPRTGGQRLKISGSQIDRIVQTYQTGTYEGGLKVSTYMQLVRDRGLNVFNPYSVQDVHMARVFGYRYRDVDPKTGNVVDAAKFPSSDAIRYGMWLTSKIAEEFKIRPDQAQAHLWFYAKRNLSPKKVELPGRKVGDGTWESASRYSQPEIDVIKAQVAAGQFDKGNPLTTALEAPSPAHFRSPKVSDPYTNIDLNEQLQALAEARAPRAFVSVLPGNARGYGMPAETRLDQLVRYYDEVIDAITDQDGQIRILRDMGIVHKVRHTMGTYERVEPTMEIVFPGETLETADMVGQFLGHALMQDATISSQPKWDGQASGVVIRKQDGTEFSNQEIVDMHRKVNPEGLPSGLNFTLTDNRTGLKFADSSYFEKGDQYTDTDLDNFAGSVSAILGDGFVGEFYREDSNYGDLTTESARDISKIWDRGGFAGRPDLQRIAVDTFYKPLQSVYATWQYRLNWTPENPVPPLAEAARDFGRDRAADRRWNVSAGLATRPDGRVPLTHWGRVGGITSLDPSFHGTGSAGAELKRAGEGYLNRTYYGLPDYQKERELAPANYRYTASVELEDLYDIRSDPIGIRVRVAVDNPYSKGASLTNLVEQAIQAEGYKGYFSTDKYGTVAAVFEPLPTESEVNELDDGPLRQDTLGQIQFGQGDALISLLENANLSTFLHESGHFFLQQRIQLIKTGQATEKMERDMATLLDWFGVDSVDQIGRDQHEQFARGFEAYLGEGRAPTTELQSLFDRFAAWLSAVYRSLTDLDVTLTKPVREVMDRMLATEAAIEESKEQMAMLPLFETADQAGMTEAEFAAYLQSLQQASDMAKADLRKRAIAEVKRERKQAWKDSLAETKAAVEQELADRPVYKATSYLMRGTLPTGEPLPEGMTPAKLSKAALVEMYGPNGDWRRLPFGKNSVWTDQGGAHPDEVAEMWGYSSGDAMVQDIIEQPSYTNAVREETNRRMVERWGDMMQDVGQLAEAAVDAMHRDPTAAHLSTELRALEKRAGLSPTPREVLKNAAQRIVSERPVGQLSEGQYLVAERKAARQAQQAVVEQDFRKASDAKRRQLLNHYLFSAARDARKKIDSTQRYLAKFDKPGTRKNLARDYLDQIDSILEGYDFRRAVSLKEIQRRKSLAEWIAEQEEQGNEVDIPRDILERSRLRHYKDLTLEELLALRDSIKNIEHLARFKQKLLYGRQQREFEAARDVLIERAMATQTWHDNPIDLSGDTAWSRYKKWGEKYNASAVKVEFLTQQMDGEVIGGPWWDTIFRPIADAENAELAMQADYGRAMSKILDRYTPQERRTWHRKFRSRELNADLNKMSILSIALNQGNADNKAKLLEGYEWTQSQVDALLDKHMTAKDWDTVQAIWDLIDTLWPGVRDIQNRLTGNPPPKVEALPVDTRFGQYKGGYYPIVYDSELSFLTFQREERKDVQDIYGSNFLRPATRKGHTIERKKGTGGQKIKLQLGVAYQHIENVIHDLTHREAILAVDKMISDPQIRNAIERTAGKEVYRTLRPWLGNVASDRRDPASGLEYMLGHLRKAATVVNMGWKVTTAIVQPLGYLQSVEILGKRWAMKGLMDFYVRRNPAKAWQEIQDKSVMMRNRTKTFDRDIRDAMKKLSRTEQLDKIKATFFMHIGFFDMMVSAPTWLGGYEKALSEGKTEEEAIAIADSTVRVSQSAGGAKDLAAIQRGTEHVRLFTMFFSYFNVLWNLLARSMRIAVRGGLTFSNVSKAVQSFLYLVVAPAVLSELIVGRGPDEDKDEEFWTWAAKTTAAYPFMTMVGARDITSYVVSGYSYSASPVFDAVESIARGALKLDDVLLGEGDETDLKHLTLAGGYMFGLPARQLWTTGHHLYEILNGEDPSLSELLLRPDDK